LISSIRSPRLAGPQPLGDHRLIADREADEHVEVLGGLPARGRGQQPTVGDRSEPDLGERLVRLGGGVGVAERLVGDQHVPGDRLQVGRVAVEHAVGGQHHPGAVAELPVEAADPPGDLPVLGDHEQLEVRRQRRQPTARGAASELLAPLAEQPPLRHDEAAEPRLGGGAVRERPTRADRLASADGRGVDAGADHLQGSHLALAAEQHRIVGQRPRHGHPHQLAGAGRQGHLRLRALERDQRAERLLGDDPPSRRGYAVGAGDREHPGAALHPPDPDVVLQLASGLGGQQQRQPRVDSRLHRLAEVHYRARVRVLLLARHRPEPPLTEPARRERQHPQLELGRRRAIGALVGAAVHGDPAPPGRACRAARPG
jgi:hypothetical protein